MTHTPAFALPDFAQSVPGDPDHYELLTENPRKSGVLQYRDPGTGQTYTVPNIPCNQQTHIRLDLRAFPSPCGAGAAHAARLVGETVSHGIHCTNAESDRRARTKNKIRKGLIQMMIDRKQLAANRLLDLQAEGQFDNMAEVLPEGKQGVARIDHFTMHPADMLASMAEHAEEFVPMGRYARLKVNGQLMMTDSPMEKRTNLEVIEKARGRVLIAGLGIGMILRTLLRKPEVSTITVLEKYQDVVDLVLPSLAGNNLISGFDHHDGRHVMVGSGRFEVIVADVFQWEPHPSLPKFHTVYFDIWPNSVVSNLPQMHLLHKRYRPLVAKGGWIGSWTYKKLVQKQRDDKRFLKQLPAQLERHWKEQTPQQFAANTSRLLAEADSLILNDEEKQAVRRFAASKGITL